MGAAGWMKVSHASGMFTSWMAFRVILRVLDLGPIVATSLKGFVSLPVLNEKVRGILPYGGDTILGARENYGKCQLSQDGQEARSLLTLVAVEHLARVCCRLLSWWFWLGDGD